MSVTRHRTWMVVWGPGLACGAFALVASLTAGAPADDTADPKATPPSFNRDVRPILSEHCFTCHGMDEKNRKGGLRLDERGAALEGGDSGEPAIVPGKPAESAIIKRITAHGADEVMPPPRAKNPLGPRQIATLRAWVAAGAGYSRHWAFEAPRKEAVPNGEHPVDFFVNRRLTSAGLQPTPPADPATLARRIHLDLVGLPPSPQQLDAFLRAYRENRARAVVELIRDLASSPQFGERWARLWLDVARFADSNGFEKDLLREMWAWRAWVIRAFNRDMPYDQFIVEQLAGDLLPDPTQDQVVATGFLRNSMINEEGAIVPEQFRMFEMFDRMDCVGKATLGLSLQCAQCHAHKFDPISQDEYYGLFAFLNNTYEAQSWVYTPEQQKVIADVHAKVAAAHDLVKKRRPGWRDEAAAWEKGVLAREVAWQPMKAVELASTGGLNHPTQEADFSILTQGHPTTAGDIFGIFTPEAKGVTGLRLEALAHRDMPFGGPGRSKYGTWAVSELRVLVQQPGGKTWEPLKLVRATADFAEPDGVMEDEWGTDAGAKKRTRGPAAYLIDGDEKTAWRADRGPGLRNQDGVAVVQFAKPLDLPAGAKLKVMLIQNHGGNESRLNTQLGSCRLSLTTAPDPKAQPVDYAAVLAMRVPPAGRTPRQQDAVFAAWVKSLPDAESRKTQAAIAAEWNRHPVGQTSVLHLAERLPQHNRGTKLLHRGEWDRPRQAVRPKVPALLHPLEAKGAAPTRLDFARWLVSRDNPLAARVAVNRVWQAMFGAGLVETAEDFGTRTAVPEYLDLLDWLAVDFMDHGWSHRHLIETIVTSATYQRSSAAPPALRERDPRNRLLARGARFRLDAEVIRDTTLGAAGILHLKDVGGPSIFPPVPQSVLDDNFTRPTYWKPPEGPERYRRALYVVRKRSMPDPVLTSFDAPNADVACARRARSNTPLSALTGLNEITFVEAAQAMALRVLTEGGRDDAARVNYAFLLCTAHPARDAERQEVLRLLAATRGRLTKGELHARPIAFSRFTRLDALPVDATPNDIAAWTVVCRVMLNLDETLCRP